jgi:DNA replication and repair protein RecF
MVGANGTGKTNVLDAIHYLSLTKSYFNVIDSQNIKHGADLMIIEGLYEYEDKEQLNLYCAVQKSRKKTFKRNKKEYQKLSDHIGLIPCVVISPTDSELISGGSEERRKFINGVISQYDKQYLEDVISYNRVLQQRNKLLKDFRKDGGSYDKNLLEIWDEQLLPLGKSIYEKRKQFANELIPVFQEYHTFISGDQEQVKLNYNSQLDNAEFADLLKGSHDKDCILQYTSTGIHKDDLTLELENHPIKKTGSQGQQKTYLLALKLAKFNFIEQTTGKKPVLLLDDIFDKFDADRVKHIIKLVSENRFGQIFITDTHKQHLSDILKNLDTEAKFFMIEKGHVNNVE